MGEKRERGGDGADPAWIKWVRSHPVVLLVPFAPFFYGSMELGLLLVRSEALALGIGVVTYVLAFLLTKYSRSAQTRLHVIAIVVCFAFWTFGSLVAGTPTVIWVRNWFGSGRAPITASQVTGAGFVLASLLGFWAAHQIAHAGNVTLPYQRDGIEYPGRRRTRSELVLGLATCLLGTTFAICIGVTVLAVGHADDMAIPVQGPLLFQILSVVGFACMFGFILTGLLWMLFIQKAQDAHESALHRRTDPGDTAAQSSAPPAT